jgi:arylsulfatase A-like enzyme
MALLITARDPGFFASSAVAGACAGAGELLFLLHCRQGIFSTREIVFWIVIASILWGLLYLALSLVCTSRNAFAATLFLGLSGLLVIRLRIQTVDPVWTPALPWQFFAALAVLVSGIAAAILSRVLPALRVRTLLAVALLAPASIAFWNSHLQADRQADGNAVHAAGPNILLVVLDTTRADHLSSLGYSRRTTPSLERMTATSMRFTRAFAPSPWTAPSHASLFTGLQPRRHGVNLTNIGPSFARKYMSAQIPTLAEILTRAGYATACFSSNVHVQASTGLTHGFAETRLDTQYYQQKPVLEATAIKLLKRATGRDDLIRPSRMAATLVDKWLDARDRDRPWFLFINLADPHLPYSPPRAALARFLGTTPDRLSGRLKELSARFNHSLAISPWGPAMSPDDTAQLNALYDGEIFFMDQELGRIIDHLERSGVLDRTMVIITADHGEGLGDHGWLGHMYQLYQSVLHVPLLIRFPKTYQPGAVCDRLTSLCDLFPTILNEVGAPSGVASDGIDLRDLVAGRKGHPYLVAEHHIPAWERRGIQRRFGSAPGARLDGVMYSVTTTDLRLIAYPDGELVLYDLARDPGEKKNLARERVEAAGDLYRLLQSWKAETPEYKPAENRSVLPSDVREQIRALGYY